jgi:hypothetical protein
MDILHHLHLQDNQDLNLHLCLRYYLEKELRKEYDLFLLQFLLENIH